MAKQSKKKLRENEELLQVAAFVLFDAVVFHEALASQNPAIAPLRTTSTGLQTFFDREWEKILRIDFEPMFSLAREILQSFPASPDTEAILTTLRDAALDALSSGVLLRHDFMGRVYHKLLLQTTGHYYATYYTSIPSAWLLATLAVKTPNPAWDFSTVEAISQFRLLDPACGSGTLLSAAYMAIKDRHILESRKRVDLAALHKALMEKVIGGWDILDYAAHLTLTTLSLHSNAVQVDGSKVFTLPAGIDSSGIHLGSLDHLGQDRLVGRGFTSAAQQGLDGAREHFIEPEEYDVVIMNPPFSRSAKPNLKFGYRSSDTRKRMNAALGSLAKSAGLSGVGQAGLGAYFMMLALRLVKNEGRVAVVIPRSMLSGVSWGLVRSRYLQQCQVEYIVSNYDPGSSEDGIEPWCWSENTDLGEVLIVARRTAKPDPDGMVSFVGLANKPKNEVESLLLSHQAMRNRKELHGTLADGVWSPLALQDKTRGYVYTVPQSALSRNWLSPCVFAQPMLNQLVMRLLEGDMPCVPFRQIASDLGVDIKQVKTHFEGFDQPSETPLVLGHQSVMNTMHLQPSHVVPGRAKSGDTSRKLHTDHASTLLVAERPHLKSEALLAMVAPKPVLTTAFWEVTLNEEHDQSAVLLWLNSTYGILQYLACATSSMADIFKMKKEQMAAMPVVDSSKAAAGFTGRAKDLLDELSHAAFLPYSAEFAQAAQGQGVRRTIDQFLARELALPEITSFHYERLASDPVVCLRRM